MTYQLDEREQQLIDEGFLKPRTKLAEWLRECADEIEKAHDWLDEQGTPRHNPATGREFTLAARIAYMGVTQMEELSGPIRKD